MENKGGIKLSVHTEKERKTSISNFKDRKPKYKNKKWLSHQYFDLQRKIKEIAEENNITVKTVHYWLRKFGFRKRSENVGNYNNHPINEDNPNWKGSQVGYVCLHNWIRRRKPKPNRCQKCGNMREYLELANISGEYRRDINDYEYLCVICHKEKDGVLQKWIDAGKATRFKKGHKNEMRWEK